MVEMIIAIGIILTSTIATATLLLSTTSLGLDSQNKTIATNFAREGVEIVRSVRDGNWLKRAANVYDGAAATAPTVQWNDSGLTNDGLKRLGENVSGDNYTHVKAIYDVTNQRWLLAPSVGSESIYWCTDHYSQSAAGCTMTKYSRDIFITKNTEPLSVGNVDYLNIISTVSWSSPGGARKVSVEERLYDWKP